MKQPLLSALCALALGSALSAFSCLPDYVVVFDKNNDDMGATEAEPNGVRLRPSSVALGFLPAEPQRPGYEFVGWNTQAQGGGMPFVASTPVLRSVTVYAQWAPAPPERHLELGLFSPDTALSPLALSTHFFVSVTGFDSEDEAGQVELTVEGVLPVALHSRLEGNAKHFQVSVYYEDAATFSEGVATFRLKLTNMPAGYAEPEGTLVHIAVMDGLEKSRRIPVTQANIEAFNGYANRAEGLGRHYRLVENISLPPPPDFAGNWTPIGTGAAPFVGSMEGGGHHLGGLRLYPPDGYPAHREAQGMFGVMGPGGVVENLGLLGVDIIHAEAGGAVVGRNQGGTVRNCHVTGKLEPYATSGGIAGVNEAGGTVENCHFEGVIRGPGGPAGGVVGRNEGVVQNCYATGTVTTVMDAGGIAGLNTGLLQNVYATNSIESSGPYGAGGVAGDNSGRVQNCYATGHVFGSYMAGGVAGANGYAQGGTVENCYATGHVSVGYGGVGGVSATHGTVRNCVALSPRLSIRDLPPLPPQLPSGVPPCGVLCLPIGRISGDMLSGASNYARSDMQVYHLEGILEGVLLGPGPATRDGQHLEPYLANEPNWWMTPAHWSTELGAMAWDFEHVWAWGSHNLPILRNIGGEQAPRLR